MYVQHPNSVLIWLFCVFTLGVVVISEKIGSNEIGDEIELAENAENVCIDQELQTQILNTTFIQSQVRSIFCKFNRFPVRSLVIWKFVFSLFVVVSVKVKTRTSVVDPVLEHSSEISLKKSNGCLLFLAQEIVPLLVDSLCPFTGTLTIFSRNCTLAISRIRKNVM